MSRAARERCWRAAALAALAAVLWFFTPPEMPLCGFRWLTGRPCPLCGLTRALFALAKGHAGEALCLHPLSPLAAVLLAALIWNRPIRARWWTSSAALFGVYGVWRILA
jgi:hypothetical protein